MNRTASTTSRHPHLDIVLASIKVFRNDGKLDLGELEHLLSLALRDQKIDDEEKRVLARIFADAEKGTIAPEVAQRIAQARQQHGIPG